MNNKIASGISYILHPIFIPTYSIASLYFLAPLSLYYLFLGQKVFFSLLVLIFIYTALVPILFIFLLKKTNFISDITLTIRKERPKIYLLVSGFFVALAYFLYSRGNVFLPTAIIIFFMAINIWGLFLITFLDKISAHIAALAGVLGIYFGIFYLYQDRHMLWASLILIVIMGITASARLFLGAHNLRQVTLGGIWGFIVGFTGVYCFIFI